MRAKLCIGLAVCLGLVLTAMVEAADVVRNEIQQPGTQPGEVTNLESPDKCDNCHGGYNPSVEPAFNWRGSMMAQATRDPIFWATLAVAEQDFDSAGDLCIRCHSVDGWVGGRSTPTDGSGLGQNDATGVACDLCHKITNPDDSDPILQGEQFPPYVANDGVTGYYGSGMYVLWGGSDKLGPYADAQARHQFEQSQFHRSRDFCGTCHDVSNAAVGDLAHNAGAQDTAEPVVRSGVLGAPVEEKAAFNNFPYQYGIVERTFSEFYSGSWPQTLVSDYPSLPAELQAGAIQAAYESAIVAGKGGDYQDGTDRFFTCQTCHLRPVEGAGCNKKGAPIRKDLPLHDMTGGNYWMPDAIAYLDSPDSLGELRLGGGLTPTELAALADGKARAMKQLSEAAALSVNGETVRIVNLTGHKLISGYPEGRRMWLNVKWYDDTGELPEHEIGAYGSMEVSIDGVPTTIETIIDPGDPSGKIYEAHYAMTQEWASQLVTLGYPEDLALSYNRVTGEVEHTLGELAGSTPGSYHETFHFVLNNYVAKDNRIPPYQMSYDQARVRNALPVPADQYGSPAPDGVYDHWDEITLSPPSGAVYATIDLLYQPTSWGYIQFLYLANTGQNPFLADEGAFLLDAWLNTGMAAPYTMASTTWGEAPQPPILDLIVESLSTWSVSKQGALVAPAETFGPGDTVAVVAHTADGDGQSLSGCQVFAEIHDAGGLVTSVQDFSDTDGNAVMTWRIPRKGASATYSANVVDAIKSGYDYDPAQSVTTVTFLVQ